MFNRYVPEKELEYFENGYKKYIETKHRLA